MNTNGHGPEPEWESNFREHFLYFPDKAAADTAAACLIAKGWTAAVSPAVCREDWLVLATDPAPIEAEFENIRRELERLAKELGGEYDGWGEPG